MVRTVVCTLGLALCVETAVAQGKPDAFFGNIALLCGALQSEGLSTRPWNNTFGTDYQCITSYVGIGTPGAAGMATNIAYYVTGDAANHAKSLKIVLNVNNRASRVAGKQKLSTATNTLFAKLGVKPPAGLMPAMQSDRPFSSKQAYGTVAYEVDLGKIDTLAVSIKAGQ